MDAISVKSGAARRSGHARTVTSTSPLPIPTTLTAISCHFCLLEILIVSPDSMPLTTCRAVTRYCLPSRSIAKAVPVKLPHAIWKVRRNSCVRTIMLLPLAVRKKMASLTWRLITIKNPDTHTPVNARPISLRRFMLWVKFYSADACHLGCR